ncbi:MAG: UDP-N-acetylmuramoyl-L-alanine--D-glutamate ligase [Burkholderiaceae bacterium]|nr:UDP-N-acetylmuramoyl-L-alanine--D-glutamate ligase [Burkholderiaceae bacterium]
MSARALVLGLGESGLAMARHLARAGFALRVADTRAAPPRLSALRAELPAAEFVPGEFSPALLAEVSQVAISPGLSPRQPAVAALLEAARQARIEVVGEIELFARALAQLAAERGYTPQVIGITGTNGKTTTAHLTALLVERAGRRWRRSLRVRREQRALDELARRLQQDALPQVWVLELSSFQLASTQSLACDAAAILNLSQDHLDWHGSMQAYAEAKARILARARVPVVNRDDAAVMALLRKSARPVTFGSGPPTQPDEWGLLREGGIDWLAYAEDLAPERRRRAAGELPGVAGQVYVQRLMPAAALRIRGRHNALNALAALALARAIGCPLAPMLHALREYRGEPHRVQPVAIIDGVEYYDDSKGTNVGATVAAIEGLAAEGRRVVAILGGDGKGQDFTPLAAPLAAHARAVVLIGRDAPAIEAALAGAGYPRERCATLPDAVQAAARLARAGDAVLLSPACASFDMFRDYAHRAEVFVAAVRELAAQRGQPC